MTRKLFASLLLFALAISFTGCGDNGNSVNKTDPKASPDPGKPGVPPPPPPPPPLPPAGK